MDMTDYLGRRGETIFSLLVGKFCGAGGTIPLFEARFLGEKAETIDFLVSLVEPTHPGACLFVQVKSTLTGYNGVGKDRKLKVRVSKSEVEKLRKLVVPTYVVGIDVVKERGYITAITQATTGGINGLPTRYPLNCRSLRALWKEVDACWTARPTALIASIFPSR